MWRERRADDQRILSILARLLTIDHADRKLMEMDFSPPMITVNKQKSPAL